MKTITVAALKADFSLALLLQVADLARSTFFYHQSRISRPDAHAELKSAIEIEFHKAKGRFGHRRVHRELMKQGWRVAKKTVLKLMRELKLKCLVRRKKRFNSFRGEIGPVAPNLLARDFEAEAPNEKWVTDVTEFRVGTQKLYLSPVMDLFDRQVISFSISQSPNLELTNSSLRKALDQLPAGEHPIVHSDQGFQYQHRSWQRLLAKAGATQSMSRKANCLDNAVIESFFGHLKEELFNHHQFIDTATLRVAIVDYIAWFNNNRATERNKGLSPVEYRAQTLVA